MKRIAQIMLTTILVLTTCFFLSINTGSALAEVSNISPKTLPVLIAETPPKLIAEGETEEGPEEETEKICELGTNSLLAGESCTFPTTGMNALSVNAYNVQPIHSVELIFSNESNGNCDKTLILDEQNPSGNFFCQPGQMPVEVLNTSSIGTATVNFTQVSP